MLEAVSKQLEPRFLRSKNVHSKSRAGNERAVVRRMFDLLTCLALSGRPDVSQLKPLESVA